MTTTTDNPDVTTADLYLDGIPHERFAAMRQTPGLVWHPYDGKGGGFWAVTRHADVKEVSKAPEIYSSGIGHSNLWDLEADALEARRSIIDTDAPDHTPPPAAGEQGVYATQHPEVGRDHPPDRGGAARRVRSRRWGRLGGQGCGAAADPGDPVDPRRARGGRRLPGRDLQLPGGGHRRSARRCPTMPTATRRRCGSCPSAVLPVTRSTSTRRRSAPSVEPSPRTIW